MTIEDFFSYNYVALFSIVFIFIALIHNKGLVKRDKVLFLIIVTLELFEFVFFNLERVVSHEGMPNYCIVLREIFSSIGYSIRPLIIFFAVKIIYTDDKSKWNLILLIPEVIVIFFAFSVFFTDICYSYTSNNVFISGPLIYIPPVGIGFYFLVMIFFFIKKKVFHQAKEMIQLFIISIFGIGSMLIDMFLNTSISRSSLVIATILCLYCIQNFRLVENINLLEENEILKQTINQLEIAEDELKVSNASTKKLIQYCLMRIYLFIE